MKRYDCAIVGAGPGGGAAAIAAADAGLCCLLLEARRTPGERTACGGGLAIGTARELELPASVAEQQLAAMAFHFRGAPDTSRVWESWRPIGVTVDRRRFDSHLAGRAQALGAEVVTEARVTGVDRDTGVVEYRQGGAVRRIAASFVVFADGATTLAPRMGDLGFISRPDNTIGAIAWEYEAPGHGYRRFDCYYDKVTVPWGYYWIFPRADVLNIGVGIVLDAVRGGAKGGGAGLPSLLARFTDSIPAIQGRHPTRRLGGLVPLEPAARVADGRLLAVGDAAGLVNPITGGGIHHAIYSGRLAGEAVAHAWKRGSSKTPYGRWLMRSPSYRWLSLLASVTAYGHRSWPGTAFVRLTRALTTFAETVDKIDRPISRFLNWRAASKWQ